MTDKLIQVTRLMEDKHWNHAVKILDQAMQGVRTTDETIAYVWKRIQCNYELKRYDYMIKDCRTILSSINQKDLPYIGVRARYMLVWALLKSNKLPEVKLACDDWLSSSVKPPITSEAERVLKKLHVIPRPTVSKKHMKHLTSLMEGPLRLWVHSFCSLEEDTLLKALTDSSHPSELINFKCGSEGINKDFSENITNSMNTTTLSVNNQPCGVVQAEQWTWREPPRGLTPDSYTLCDSYSSRGICRYGAQCVDAHSAAELAEWKERFERRKQEAERTTTLENRVHSYTEQILEKIMQSGSSNDLLKEKIGGVEDTSSDDLETVVYSKKSEKDWVFTFSSRKMLKGVALLQDAHREHFYIKDVIVQSGVNSYILTNPDVKKKDACQEWSQNKHIHVNTAGTNEQKVIISFKTQIYGTFRQTVLFDFGDLPYLVKQLCVNVIPAENEKINEIIKDIRISTKERWDSTNKNIIPFHSLVYPDLKTPYSPGDATREQMLESKYPCPKLTTFNFSANTINEKHLDKMNYRSRMHELLYIEEMARAEQVANYNVCCALIVAPSYLLTPASGTASTAKYAHDGELFAVMTLKKEISEDTTAGRLILNNCSTVLIGPQVSPPNQISIVYEALIEDKGKNTVYLRLPKACVKGLGILADTDYNGEIQFQLNRLMFCEWHNAIDQLSDTELVFPAMQPVPRIPWSPDRQWNELLELKMNSKQREAVVAITTPLSYRIPPILLIGPFGTGKTYTIAQSIRQLLHQPEATVLICTHSNSAADLYIKDFLDPWCEAGLHEARPLRIYYHKRWVATVNQTVQKYCLIQTVQGARCFRLPTLEDVRAARIVVVTLSTSMYLSTLGLPKGHFTHIFLDEAAQAMESEALMPLSLATAGTRLVLAGDHMQLSPEVYSTFAEERNLQVSLLERLYEHYPPLFPCKILLCENYRAHQAIVEFTSALFYEQRLVASGRQPAHPALHPLAFYTTRGEDVQDPNSTAYYNLSEVYELSERITELKRTWPEAWGKMDENSIGVMTPYADQVFRIRSELRKRRLGSVSVERVLNVQGKEFRAVFLSTVRTRVSCAGAGAGGGGGASSSASRDYGFLSDLKLLNTAITRARSLVAVVGDPLALCTVGRCTKLWERYLAECHQHGSLHGITWDQMRAQLDAIELKKNFVLNPLAPEFVPRKPNVDQPAVDTYAIRTYPLQYQNRIPVPMSQNVPKFYPSRPVFSFAPPPRSNVPDSFRFRPPFVGPMSNPFALPVLPLRPPQEHLLPPPRPPVEIPMPVIPHSLDDHFKPLMAMNQPPKMNPPPVNYMPPYRPFEKPQTVTTSTHMSEPVCVARSPMYAPPMNDMQLLLRSPDPVIFRQSVNHNGPAMPSMPIVNGVNHVKDMKTYQEPKLYFEESATSSKHLSRLGELVSEASRPGAGELPPGAPPSTLPADNPSKLKLWLHPVRDDIQFFQNVHFPDKKICEVSANESEHLVYNINKMFAESGLAAAAAVAAAEESGAAGGGAGAGAMAGGGGAGGRPLYARQPRTHNM